MRIVIEMDGVESRAPAGSGEGMSAQYKPKQVDGGPGPGGDWAVSAGMEMDSNGPPQSLLNEIAAVEASENQATSTSDVPGATDTGASPSGQ